jgi:hypothetical protein
LEWQFEHDRFALNSGPSAINIRYSAELGPVCARMQTCEKRIPGEADEGSDGRRVALEIAREAPVSNSSVVDFNQ